MFLTIHDWTLPIRDPVFLFGILMLTILTVPALLQRYKLPGIVGLILAGALLGPNGTNLMEQGEGIKLLAQIGLLYIMFWAGLEINMADFLKNKHKSIAFGMLTFLLPLTIGGLSAYWLLGFDPVGSLLLASMFSTHTLISYPIVNRLHITQNEAVAVTVGGTVITDTLALLLLAILTGMVQGEANGWFFAKLSFSLAVFVAVVFGLVPRIAKWYFRKVQSDLTNQFVFVLATVFLCGLLAQLAGVEAIIGAFMAGLVLNRLIPHASPLMNRIEFVGNGVFIPAFLFNVGMLVNLSVFFEGKKAIITALLLTGIALLTKWAAAFGTQQLFGYSKNQRNLIFGLSSSHAAATIAIILVGYQLHIFDAQVLNATVFLIFVTCLVSTLTTDRAAKKLAAERIASLPLPDQAQCIIVPYANPANLPFLVDFSFLVKMPGEQEPVNLLAIYFDEKEVRKKIQQEQQILEPLIKLAADRHLPLAPIHRVDVNAVSGILHTANERSATDIIIGWKPTLSNTDKLFGTLHDNLLEESFETLFVTHFTHSPLTFKHLKLIFAKNAHLEPTFSELAKRIDSICTHLPIPLTLISSAPTFDAFRLLVSKKTSASLLAQPLDDDAFFQLHKNEDEALALIVSARRESISYENFMERLPSYLAKKFTETSFVLVFPAV